MCALHAPNRWSPPDKRTWCVHPGIARDPGSHTHAYCPPGSERVCPDSSRGMLRCTLHFYLNFSHSIRRSKDKGVFRKRPDFLPRRPASALWSGSDWVRSWALGSWVGGLQNAVLQDAEPEEDRLEPKYSESPGSAFGCSSPESIVWINYVPK